MPIQKKKKTEKQQHSVNSPSENVLFVKRKMCVAVPFFWDESKEKLFEKDKTLVIAIINNCGAEAMVKSVKKTNKETNKQTDGPHSKKEMIIYLCSAFIIIYYDFITIRFHHSKVTHVKLVWSYLLY